MTPINAVLFDLDGTLLDTAPDLYEAMRRVLKNYGKPTVEFESFRYQVHAGTDNMVSFSVGVNSEHTEFEQYKKEFLENYRNQLTTQTSYFPGAETVLQFLDDKQMSWGIVTNKPAWLTDPLIQSFGLDKRTSCIISGDTLATRKPDPAVLLHACQITNSVPTETVYVGDIENDVIAAHSAGMLAAAVEYGYHPENQQPSDWQAEIVIESLLELIDWLDKVEGK